MLSFQHPTLRNITKIIDDSDLNHLLNVVCVMCPSNVWLYLVDKYTLGIRLPGGENRSSKKGSCGTFFNIYRMSSFKITIYFGKISFNFIILVVSQTIHDIEISIIFNLIKAYLK